MLSALALGAAASTAAIEYGRRNSSAPPVAYREEPAQSAVAEVIDDKPAGDPVTSDGVTSKGSAS
jgi:hypothetical protein